MVEWNVEYIFSNSFFLLVSLYWHFSNNMFTFRESTVSFFFPPPQPIPITGSFSHPPFYMSLSQCSALINWKKKGKKEKVLLEVGMVTPERILERFFLLGSSFEWLFKSVPQTIGLHVPFYSAPSPLLFSFPPFRSSFLPFTDRFLSSG